MNVYQQLLHNLTASVSALVFQIKYEDWSELKRATQFNNAVLLISAIFINRHSL